LSGLSITRHYLLTSSDCSLRYTSDGSYRMLGRKLEKAENVIGRVVGLVVWFSDNALVSINAVALHRARLVLGWVTAFGQVNCLIT